MQYIQDMGLYIQRGLKKKYPNTYRYAPYYQWIDNSAVDFMDWGYGQPDINNEKCTELHTHGSEYIVGWNDMYCDLAKTNVIALCHNNKELTCGFTKELEDSFGAPKPSISTFWDNQHLNFQISMKNHPKSLAKHFISFEPIPIDYQYVQESIIVESSDWVMHPTDELGNDREIQEVVSVADSTGEYHNYANRDTMTGKTFCETKYSIKLDWSSPFVSRVYDDRKNQIVLKVTLYAYYLFADDSSKQIKRVVYPFEQVVNAKLTSDATSVFDTQQLEILRFSLVELTQVKSEGSQASLQLIASLTCNQKFQVADVSFVSSTEPLLRLKDVALPQFSTTRYTINMLTQSFSDRDAPSLTTAYVIRANVIDSNTGASLSYDIPFNIYYSTACN